jgi:hypothetical protein
MMLSGGFPFLFLPEPLIHRNQSKELIEGLKNEGLKKSRNHEQALGNLCQLGSGSIRLPCGSDTVSGHEPNSI